MPPKVLTDEQIKQLMNKQSGGSPPPREMSDDELQRHMQSEVNQTGESRSDRVLNEAKKRAAEEQFMNIREQNQKQEESPFAENLSLWERVKRMGSKVIESERNFGDSIADSLLQFTPEYKNLEEARANATKQQQALLDYILAKRAKGEDTTRLMKAYQASLEVPEGTTDFDIMPSINKTKKQVIGEAAGVGVDIISFGSLGSATKFIAGSKTATQGLLRGGVVGMGEGAAIGGSQSVSRSMQNNDSVADTLFDAGKNAVVGGALGMVGGGLFGSVTGKFNRSKEIRDALKAVDESGIPSSTAVGYRKNAAGLVSSDRTAQRAVKVGLAPDDVQLMKAANPETKKYFQRIFRISEFKSTHRASAQRASDLVGESAAKRLKYLYTTRQGVGKQIGAMIDKAPNKPIDVSDVYIDLITDLEKHGVRTLRGGLTDFSNSRFRDNAKAQSVIKDVIADLYPDRGSSRQLTPKQIYRIRQIWFDNMKSANQKMEIVASDPTNGIIEGVRNRLEKHLTDAVPKYGEKAQEYAELSTVLRNQDKAIGRDFKLDSPQVERKLAEIYGRIEGRASAKYLQLLGELDDAARSYGYKGKENMRHLVLFSDFMEDIFPSTVPRKSLHGEVARATSGTAEDLFDIARGDVVGVGVKGALKGMFSKTPSEMQDLQIKAIKEIIGLR